MSSKNIVIIIIMIINTYFVLPMYYTLFWEASMYTFQFSKQPTR